MKTTGYLDNLRDSTNYIKIKPSYYYISKDGQTFIDKIKLYYKDSTGKYISLDENPYNIYYKPYDGYRYLNESQENVEFNWNAAEDAADMSDKLLKLNINEIKISSNSATTNNGKFIQTWFGEFKLPNSTIAIDVRGEEENSEYNNLNNPLKDGYIGVKFNIEYIYYNNGSEKNISYNINNKAANPEINTTQWDYEGYMYINKPGASHSTTWQLEKGIWKISNERYNDIKGTVILYDTDARAANDFN